MAKLIEYDVSSVEESSGGTGVKVKPGVKIARIEQCFKRETKSDGTPADDIKVALNFGSEFDWGFTYVGLGEASDWKLAEFIRALDLKEKGKFDPEKQVGKFVRVKVNPGTYEGEYSPQMGRLMKPQQGDEEAWTEGNGTASELSSQGDGPEEDEPAAAATAEKEYPAGPDFTPSREKTAEGEIDPEVGSYDDWADDDLIAECTDRGLTLPGGRGSKRDKAIAALRAEDDEVYGGTSEEPEAEAEAGTVAEPGDDYDTWDVEQLKTEWTEREMGDLPSIKGRNAEARLTAAITEALRKDDVENPFSA